MSKIVERVRLNYREGPSDKVYVIELTEVSPGMYSVTGYNGRRGSQLVAQPKTSVPVSLTEARRIFDGLERAKLNHPKTPYKVSKRQTNSTPAGAKQKEDASATATTASAAEAETSAQPPSNEGYRASHLDALEF